MVARRRRGFVKGKFTRNATSTRSHYTQRDLLPYSCSIGVNVGTEIDGKSADFSRLVLVVKWVNNGGFFGIPLTSGVKNGSGWYRYDHGSLVFAQMRFYDAQRLLGKKSVMKEEEFRKVREALIEYMK